MKRREFMVDVLHTSDVLPKGKPQQRPIELVRLWSLSPPTGLDPCTLLKLGVAGDR